MNRVYGWVGAGLYLFLFSALLWAGEMRVQNLDGTPVNLFAALAPESDTLVVIWSLDCAVCADEMPLLSALHGRAVTVVGLVLDGPEQRSAIVQRIRHWRTSFDHYLVFPDVFAEQFAQAFDRPFRATPTHLLLDSGGQLLGVQVGRLPMNLLETLQ